MTFDLAENKDLSGFSYWGYSVTGNSAKDISLRFATEADGTGGFGTSISDNPSFVLAPGVQNSSTQPRQDFAFSTDYTARYVEVTVTDNYFGSGAGGDRVGMGELLFDGQTAAIPVPFKPSANLGILTLLGLVGLNHCRKKLNCSKDLTI